MYKTLNMRLRKVLLAADFRSLIGHLLVTFGGAPNSNVDDSLDDTY